MCFLVYLRTNCTGNIYNVQFTYLNLSNSLCTSNWNYWLLVRNLNTELLLLYVFVNNIKAQLINNKINPYPATKIS